MTRAQFAAANRSEVTGSFLPIVGVLLAVAFVVGCTIVGITIYTTTVERTREYGILKAIGATRRDLFRIVLTQSLFVGAVGYLLGVPLAFAVNDLAARAVPEFITLIRGRDILAVGVAALGMAVLATLIPVRRVAAIDPASVFRA
jgi:putative ABC transport system permease protein